MRIQSEGNYMNITATSVNTNAAQQETSSSNIKNIDNSIGIEIGKALINNKTDKVENQKEIAKIEAKIAEKTEELNKLLDKINKNKFSAKDRECIARKKHPIAYYGSNVGMGVAAGGACGLITGILSADFPLAAIGGLAAAAGVIVGAGCCVYFDYKMSNITDEEIRNVYTQKANDLKAEIAKLKQELKGLK